MQKRYTMRQKEIKRLEILHKLDSKQIRQNKAAEILGISVRQVQRLLSGYLKQGPEGIVSKKFGKPSNNCTSEAVKEMAVFLIRKHYHDFGPTLATEKLRECHDVHLSIETIRKLMIDDGLWIPRKQRLKRVYQPRYRRDCYGDLIQIDGSYHYWFEDRGPQCTLLVYIDDATSKLMMAKFFPEESTFGYFKATEEYLLQHGKPISFYSDKYSVFRVVNQHAKSGDGVTQFGRALSDLNMDIIYANTCQAKGRVERANKTLQDRLVKELRLKGISTMEEANLYLPDFIEDYNKRFAKEPKGLTNMHRSLQQHERNNLKSIFSWQEDRTLSNNLTIQYDKFWYLIEDTLETRQLARKRVTVYEDFHGRIKIFYEGKELPYRVFDKINRRVDPNAIVENKRLGNALKFIQERQALYEQEHRSTRQPSRTHLKTADAR